MRENVLPGPLYWVAVVGDMRVRTMCSSKLTSQTAVVKLLVLNVVCMLHRHNSNYSWDLKDGGACNEQVARTADDN